MPTLEVYKGKNSVGSFFLTESIITIGRAGDNDIVLPDSQLRVSRYHAVLLKDLSGPESYTIRDLSSTWGTKVGKRFVFQKLLEAGETINILDYHLHFVVSPKDDRIQFMVTDEILNGSSSFSQEMGTKSTLTGRKIHSLKSAITGLPEDTMMLIEEFLSGGDNVFSTESLLDNAVDLVFTILKLEEDCHGCFILFDEEGDFRCLSGKGMENRASIQMPRIAIDAIRDGEVFSNGKQLWVPLTKGKKYPHRFLYLCRGPYALDFQGKEVEAASHICSLVAQILENKEDDITSVEEFSRWPREVIGGDQTFREIRRIAPLEGNVLLLGETGVGKEVAAKEIHRRSKRREKVLRVVNCPGLSKDLIESELFGHKKGAFTGATDDKKGEFELADAGTIFLDEIADLPWDSQRKVLRVIQEKVIKRVGEEKEKKVDVRIMAATNRDIQKDMESGRFGSDLFYRFGERISIPPLRERKKDIPLLAHYFLDKHALEYNMTSRGITPQAMKCLLSYSWHGNIRELQGCISSALSRSRGFIFVQHLPERIRKYRIHEKGLKEERRKPKSMDEQEVEHILETLQFTRGNKERAIEILGISKQTLYNKIEKYKLPVNYGKSK